MTLQPLGYTNGSLLLSVSGPVGPDYILQGSLDLQDWLSVASNAPLALPLLSATRTRQCSRTDSIASDLGHSSHWLRIRNSLKRLRPLTKRGEGKFHGVPAHGHAARLGRVTAAVRSPKTAVSDILVAAVAPFLFSER